MSEIFSYTIREILSEDKEAILDIWEERLAHGYPREKELNEALDVDSDTVCLVAVESNTRTVVGFAIGLVLSVEAFNKKLGSDSLPWDSGEIVLLDTNCVCESYVNYGIGTNLMQKRLDEFSSLGFTRFVSFCWLRSEGQDSSGILEKNGFSVIEEFPNYWYESSIEDGFTCPDCGNPCFCDAQLYVKDISYS
jgi:ribosomal protein S18 acetylase RimI-like enzyme